MFGENSVSINYIRDRERGWDIVNVSSQEEVMAKINQQQRMIFTLLLCSVVALIVMMY